MKIKGTCQVCGAQVPWHSSTLDAHTPEGEPASRHSNRCPGSGKKPTEALAPARRMTEAEASLARRMFG